MTMREMCERMAAEIERRGGPKLDPERDIFEMDPHGELWPVYELYWLLFPEEAPQEELYASRQ